jgi:short-subunit dehydrogenase
VDITNSTIVLITGASSGIGAALAVAIAKYGAKVAICARRQERLEQIAERIREAGGTPLALLADVSKKAEAEKAVQNTIDTFGGIDVLVNNAGRGNVAAVEDTSQKQLESIFSVNVYSLWYTTAVALPVMKAQKRGHIINMSSLAGKAGFPYSSAYIAAKHACVGFTAALRTELIDTGVEATVICPVNVQTEWGQKTEGGSIEQLFMSGMQQVSTPIEGQNEQPLHEIPPSLIADFEASMVFLTPEAVAAVIIDTIQNPQKADVFTHPGSEELAISMAQDRRVTEKLQSNFFLGMRKAYKAMRKQEV